MIKQIFYVSRKFHAFPFLLTRATTYLFPAVQLGHNIVPLLREDSIGGMIERSQQKPENYHSSLGTSY